jgi:hypothetical protein
MRASLHMSSMRIIALLLSGISTYGAHRIITVFQYIQHKAENHANNCMRITFIICGKVQYIYKKQEGPGFSFFNILWTDMNGTKKRVR